MSEPTKPVLCLYNHGTKLPHATYCPECLSIASADKDKRIEEARKIIEHIGWTSAAAPSVIRAAEKWLEDKP